MLLENGGWGGGHGFEIQVLEDNVGGRVLSNRPLLLFNVIPREKVACCMHASHESRTICKYLDYALGPPHVCAWALGFVAQETRSRLCVLMCLSRHAESQMQ